MLSIERRCSRTVSGRVAGVLRNRTLWRVASPPRSPPRSPAARGPLVSWSRTRPLPPRQTPRSPAGRLSPRAELCFATTHFPTLSFIHFTFSSSSSPPRPSLPQIRRVWEHPRFSHSFLFRFLFIRAHRRGFHFHTRRRAVGHATRSLPPLRTRLHTKIRNFEKLKGVSSVLGIFRLLTLMKWKRIF